MNNMMHENINDILSNIINGISENKPLEEIEKKLQSSKYYNTSAVAAAYSWIFDRIMANLLIKDVEEEPAEKNKISRRFYSKEETDRLGAENLNHLFRLKNFGLLTHKDINHIVEWLSLSPIDHLTKYELNLVILGMLLENKQIVPPGSRTNLFLNDQVN